jgi:Kef-type K+ transport system membrane component KefB
MQQFTAALHQDVLALLIQVTVLLFTARLLGELAQRIGQPSIVGEIFAGVLLGPSFLSGLVPMIGTTILPETQVPVSIMPQTQVQVHLLDTFSLLGALFMMLIAGLEIDLALIRRHARSSIGTGLGGMILPFIAGFALAYYLLPDSILTSPDQRLIFSLFIATALAVSAIPVIAKVLIEMNLMRRDVSQILISAAMIEDAIVWMMLSVFIGMAEGTTITAGGLMLSVGKVLGFIGLSFTLGRWFVRWALNVVQEHVRIHDSFLSLVVILMFGWGAVSQALHLEAVLGAFVVGIILSQMRYLPDRVIRQLESIALGIFAPIFFAVAGLKVNLWNFLNPQYALIAVAVIGVASITKITGAYLGVRLIAKRDHWTALSLGVGLNTHGAIEIIIASIALSKGIFTQEMFSVIVLMSLVTSLITPTALRYVLKFVQAEDEEIQRLKHEELVKDNPFAHVRRVLVPVRRRDDDREGPEQMLESVLLQNIAARKELQVTLLNIASDGNRQRSMIFLDKLSRVFLHLDVSKKVVVSDNPTQAILDEAKKGYDLLIMGATVSKDRTEELFNPLVDSLVRMSPCPSLVVHAEHVPHDWIPNRILAPTNGSIAARRSVQAAFSLAQGVSGEVLVLKVVNMEMATCNLETREQVLERQYAIAHQIVDELGTMGQSLGIRTYTAVHPGTNPEDVILDSAKSAYMDLIILGTNIRAGTERLYMGSRVERILNQAHCPVIVVNS